MKKSVKITAWIVGTLAFLIIAVFLSANVFVSRVVQKELARTFDSLPDADASIGGVYLDLLSGSAIVKDITFCTYGLTLEDSVSGMREPGLVLHIPGITVWGVSYRDLLREHRLHIRSVSVDDPDILVYLDEENPAALMPVFPKDTTLKKANQWLHAIELQSFAVNNLRGRLRSTRTPLHLVADSLSIEIPDLAYNFIDSVFSYNDSVYTLVLKTLCVETPDGLMAVETHDVQTANQGPLTIGYTRLRNTIAPKQLADMRREPSTWIDLEVNSVSTSALNPIRKALAADWNLDSIYADIRRMHVVRDERHKPTKPFPTPQEVLLKAPVRFGVRQVNALARNIDIRFVSTDINCGELHFKNIRARLDNVTNRPGAVWYSRAHAPLGKQGKADATLAMYMDKASTFELGLTAQNAGTEEFNPFIRPLVGITSTCHIDQLDARYKGDKTVAKGEFCMQYHGLEVKVHKEDKIPYEVITKNADFFTGVANTLIPKSNPTAVDPAPRKYKVEWKRDEWKPYPLYLFGPCIDGIKMTMLPGLYVHKQVKK